MLHKLRISITGPESCGKSVLSKQLAKHFKAVYCEEVSRKYLKGKSNYHFEDILEIAKLQFRAENTVNKGRNSLLFCDTDILVNKIWSEYVFSKVDMWIEDTFKEHEYGLYLLCYPDLEWEYDPLRENPTNRMELFEMYENELKKSNYNYKIVKGQGNKRLVTAVSSVNEYLKTL